jgi:hypothetical protein
MALTELTEEQREQIRRNRERAIQKQKERKERLEKEKQEKENEQTEKRELEKKTIASSSPSNKKQKVELELEDFEVGASEWISKTEAMKMYCVPHGTLAVCEVEERPNPHNQRWKPMKLYRRSEVRERSRKRWEGMEGLCAEREKRQQKQLERDMETAQSIFE